MTVGSHERFGSVEEKLVGCIIFVTGSPERFRPAKKKKTPS